MILCLCQSNWMNLKLMKGDLWNYIKYIDNNIRHVILKGIYNIDKRWIGSSSMRYGIGIC
jgi:uncharacterized protein YraI